MTVYFIKAGDIVAIKIGYTAGEPLARMADLQVGCPLKLELIGAVDGEQAQEVELHRKLCEHRAIGEWFNPHEVVLSTVEYVLAHGAPPAATPVAKRPKHQNAACEIIDRLGGNSAVAKLTDNKPSVISNWRKFGKFPSNTFCIFADALGLKEADMPNLWGMFGHSS